MGPAEGGDVGCGYTAAHYLPCFRLQPAHGALVCTPSTDKSRVLTSYILSPLEYWPAPCASQVRCGAKFTELAGSVFPLPNHDGIKDRDLSHGVLIKPWPRARLAVGDGLVRC